MKRMSATVIILFIMAGFVFSLFKLCDMRFEQGDIYPAYSSLRCDPLGTKGLYEALSLTPGLHVTRNYTPVNQARVPGQSTWFVIGGKPRLDPDYLHLIRSGTRMIVAFNQSSRNSVSALDVSLNTLPSSHEPFAEKQEQASDRLPTELPWQDSSSIRPTHDDWQVIYSVQDQPVILERHMGLGSVVVLANSFLLSNEALTSQRETELIAWLCGQNTSLVFDETIHGIQASQGIMTLARTYHLKGLALGLFVLIGLFVWSRTPILTTPEHTETKVIQTHAMDSGLTSLLTHHLDPKTWLATSFQQWRQHLDAQPHLKQRLDSQMDALERLSQAKSPKQAVTQYNLITDIITKREPYDTST